jgi:hypothetical protein
VFLWELACRTILGGCPLATHAAVHGTAREIPLSIMKSTILSPEPFSVPLSSSPVWADLTDATRTAEDRFARVFELEVAYLRSLRSSKEDREQALGKLTEELASQFPRVEERVRDSRVLASLFGLGSGAVAAILRALPAKPTSGRLAKLWDAAEQRLEATMSHLQGRDKQGRDKQVSDHAS